MSQERLLLSIDERHEKHRILLRDTVALATLSALVLVLSVTTWLLFHSFAAHRRMLEQRWRARGDAALAAGNPAAALAGLHSALAYAPEDRGLQVELAMALAASGKAQEAQVYFNTLLEKEPGSGLINLQLARLAVRQNNTQSAVDHYQAAIDGTWNGDAYTRRRVIRLELSKYLVGQQRLPEARNQLLIAAGNAPQDAALQMQVGQLLLSADDAADAMDVFHRATQDKGGRLEGLIAEGQTALSLGRFQAAHVFLLRATAEPAFAKQPDAEKKTIHQELTLSQDVLALYPADTLSPQERARRIEQMAALAQKRLLSCPAVARPAAGGAGAVGTASTRPRDADSPPGAGQTAAGTRTALLSTLAAHLRNLNPLTRPGAAPTAAATRAASPSVSPASDPLSVLAARWTAVPTGAALDRQLVSDPNFAASTLALIYETARATTACGALTGEDAALARIAVNPGQVEAQP